MEAGYGLKGSPGKEPYFIFRCPGQATVSSCRQASHRSPSRLASDRIEQNLQYRRWSFCHLRPHKNNNLHYEHNYSNYRKTKSTKLRTIVYQYGTRVIG